MGHFHNDVVKKIMCTIRMYTVDAFTKRGRTKNV